MYEISISSLAKNRLKDNIIKKSIDGIEANLKVITQDPIKNGKAIHKNNLSQFYKNSGNKYAIAYNVDEAKKIVDVVNIVRRELLHKMLSVN